MARTYRLVGTFRTAAIAAFLAGAPTLASANHELYPPGWNTPSQPGPLLFQFVPGGSRYHVVKPATTQNVSTKPVISSQPASNTHNP
jgi:hypothetical protein